MKYLLLCVLIVPALAMGQGYPQGYFRNPLNIPILLAGNFGECRPGHFHSGIDIKTEGRENLPVYAAADGYISRIKMEPGGFGHGLYITHPNGYTTLYAHLNYFVPEVQAFVRRQQYAKESWTIDLSLKPDVFPVKKGDQIAWSGNTGGSTAPHLHFEIRNSQTERPLNPLLFGVEVKDNRAPVVRQLAIYDMERGLYDVNPKMVTLRKNSQEIYVPKEDTISIGTQLAGIGIVSDDYMDGSDNTLAWYTADWYVDDAQQGRIRLDDIGYDETRYLHAFADYRTKQNGGPWVQCLFRLPGNALTRIYESLNANNGLLGWSDGQYHNVRIVLNDAKGNQSEVRFKLKTVPNAVTLPCAQKLLAGKPNSIANNNIAFVLDETELYADACVEVASNGNGDGISDVFTVGRPDVPVHHSFELQLKPKKLIPFALRNKIATVYREGKESSGTVAKPSEQGWYTASVRRLGEYRLEVDTVAPVVKPIGAIKGNLSKVGKIAVRVTDDITSVRSLRAMLDGKWLLFEQHGDVWTYVMDEHCPKGAHKLNITVSDENGNVSTSSFAFSR